MRTKNSQPMTAEEQTQAAALLASGMTANAVGLTMGRDPKTIRTLAAKPGTAVMVADFTERFAGKLEATAERILDSISEIDIEKASLKDKAISSSIFFDKQRLARGQSTSNVSVLFQISAECERKCREDSDAYAKAAGWTVDAEAVEPPDADD